MKLVKNFLWNAGYQIFILIIPFITIPYVNRVLGPTDIGINSYTNSIVQYFILFGSMGINIYGNREIAYHRDNLVERSQIFWEIAFLRMIFIGIAVIAYLCFLLLVHSYRIFFLIQGIALIGTAFDISWFFQGMENFKVTVLRSTFVRILSLIATFAFVKNANDTWIYILIIVLSQALGYITLWPYLRGHVERPERKQLHMLRHIRPSIALLIPQIATQVYLQLNKTMLGSLRSVVASGYYDNSDKMVKIVLAIVTATGTVLLPHVANSFARGDSEGVKRSLHSSMHVILFMAFPMAAGLMAVSYPFTILFFSSKFAAVAKLMSVESVVIVLIGISNAIGVQYLLPTNQLKLYTTSVVLGSVANIIINVPLILAFGTMGAIIATVISETVVSGYQLYKVRDQIDTASLFNETWKYAVAAILMFVCVRWIGHLAGISLIGLLVQVVSGILCYSLVILVERPHYIFSMFKSLKTR